MEITIQEMVKFKGDKRFITSFFPNKIFIIPFVELHCLSKIEDISPHYSSYITFLNGRHWIFPHCLFTWNNSNGHNLWASLNSKFSIVEGATIHGKQKIPPLKFKNVIITMRWPRCTFKDFWGGFKVQPWSSSNHH